MPKPVPVHTFQKKEVVSSSAHTAGAVADATTHWLHFPHEAAVQIDSISGDSPGFYRNYAALVLGTPTDAVYFGDTVAADAPIGLVAGEILDQELMRISTDDQIYSVGNFRSHSSWPFPAWPGGSARPANLTGRAGGVAVSIVDQTTDGAAFTGFLTVARFNYPTIAATTAPDGSILVLTLDGLIWSSTDWTTPFHDASATLGAVLYTSWFADIARSAPSLPDNDIIGGPIPTVYSGWGQGTFWLVQNEDAERIITNPNVVREHGNTNPPCLAWYVWSSAGEGGGSTNQMVTTDGTHWDLPHTFVASGPTWAADGLKIEGAYNPARTTTTGVANVNPAYDFHSGAVVLGNGDLLSFQTVSGPASSGTWAYNVLMRYPVDGSGDAGTVVRTLSTALKSVSGSTGGPASPTPYDPILDGPYTEVTFGTYTFSDITFVGGGTAVGHYFLVSIGPHRRYDLWELTGDTPDLVYIGDLGEMPTGGNPYRDAFDVAQYQYSPYSVTISESLGAAFIGIMSSQRYQWPIGSGQMTESRVQILGYNPEAHSAIFSFVPGTDHFIGGQLGTVRMGTTFIHYGTSTGGGGPGPRGVATAKVTKVNVEPVEKHPVHTYRKFF